VTHKVFANKSQSFSLSAVLLWGILFLIFLNIPTKIYAAHYDFLILLVVLLPSTPTGANSIYKYNRSSPPQSAPGISSLLSSPVLSEISRRFRSRIVCWCHFCRRGKLLPRLYWIIFYLWSTGLDILLVQIQSNDWTE